jgi:hypothetical protein
MWTLETLKAVIAERGETSPDAAQVGKVLLAHERFRGRTEEDYPREKAEQELDDLLDQQVTPLPVARADEYPGLKQLRAHAADRSLQRAVARSNAPEKALVVERAAARIREPERERS